MNRRSFFSRVASTAAGIVLASSVEVFGIKPESQMPGFREQLDAVAANFQRLILDGWVAPKYRA